MSLIKYRFHSEVLNMDTEVNIVMPEAVPENRYPVLYLLHGAGGDCDSWLRSSSIERYAQRYGIAVVMPSAYNSCYADMVHGIPYFTFLSEELPKRLEKMFPIANERSGRYVAGLSMGGRGAFLWALRCPDFFSASVCLSGSLDVASMAKRMLAQNDTKSLERFINAFGNPLELTSENDIYQLAKKAAESGLGYPRLLYMCGREDIRYKEQYLPFLKYCDEIGLKIACMEDSGDHNFDYWDPAIAQAIAWMRQTRQSEEKVL